MCYSVFLEEELRYLELLPIGVWVRLAEATRGACSASRLRNYTLHAAHTVCGYCNRFTLRQYQPPPWTIDKVNVRIDTFAVFGKYVRGVAFGVLCKSAWRR